MVSIKRGDIILVNFDPTVGAETQKTRPALVVSNDINNVHSPIVSISPITSNVKRVYSFEVEIPAGMGGLKIHCKIMIKRYKPRPVGGEPMAGFPKGRRIPLVEGGVNAPPENASVQGGRRSPCREFTHQTRAVDKIRLIKKLGQLTSSIMAEVDQALRIHYDLE